jgi:hypothetical protein
MNDKIPIKGETARRVSDVIPAVRWSDGSIGRVSKFSDGIFDTESWDERSKSWVRGGLPMTSLVTSNPASPEELVAAGIPVE